MTSTDDLVAEYLDLTDRIEQMDTRRGIIRATLAELGEGRHDTASGVAIHVTIPKRFNAKRAAAELPSDLAALCQDFSATKAKQILAPALYSSFAEPGRPVVTIR